MNFVKKNIKQHSFRFILSRIDFHCGFGALERWLSANWFNPLYTLWFNFRSFSFRQAIAIHAFIYGFPKFFSLVGHMEIHGSLHAGMIKINQTRTLSPNNTSLPTEINNQGLIIFRGKVFIGTGNKIVVSPKGKLDFGNDNIISNFVNNACFSNIKTGSHTRIAHRSQLLDTNYHYIVNMQKRVIPSREHLIIIGNRCWICNNTTITDGRIINIIVSSNSLANKDYSNIPKDSIIGGFPARLIACGFRRIENV